MGEDLEHLRKVAEEATLGPWRREPQGGSSTVLAATKPPRNDTRIPSYGYRDPGEHCLAYPFLSDAGEARLDFVSFSHEDASHIATFDPPTVLSLLDTITAQAARIAELEVGLLRTAANLAAAISLLERSPKKAAASDKMFDQMLEDYRATLDRARALLPGEHPSAGDAP